MTPPDSGEREVWNREVRQTQHCPATAHSHHLPVAICGACKVALPGHVVEPNLAQRILAALEQEARSGNVTAHRLEALASELRAAVERKP